MARTHAHIEFIDVKDAFLYAWWQSHSIQFSFISNFFLVDYRMIFDNKTEIQIDEKNLSRFYYGYDHLMMMMMMQLTNCYHHTQAFKWNRKEINWFLKKATEIFQQLEHSAMCKFNWFENRRIVNSIMKLNHTFLSD